MKDLEAARAWLNRAPPKRSAWYDFVRPPCDERDWYEFALELLELVDEQLEAGHG